MRTNEGENRRDQSRLAALTEAAREPDLDRRWAALAKTLDLDRFISFLAVEVLICHWDGYGLNRNNYRIYHDRQTDRLVFFPQGVDQTFQRQNIAPFPPMQGLVAKAVLEIPQGSERYRARMVELLTNVFQVPALTNHLLEVAARVQPVLEEVDGNAANSYSARVAAFRRKIQQRFSSMKRQLLYTTPPQRLESAGALTLSEWQPKSDFGQATLQREKGQDGTAMLHIEAHEASAGSWRSRVELDRGHYRLEGKVRLQGVKLNAEDAKAGAGLRISRRKFERTLAGDMSWTTLGYDFQVTQERAEVELVCELRAEEGQAWFDLASLRLIRKP